MSKRLRGAGALLVVAATVLTACSSTGQAADPATAPGPAALSSAAGPVTVTLWHGLGGAAGDALKAEVDRFNAANTGKIQVKAAFQGSYADAIAKYTSAVRDRTTPGIMLTNDVTTGFLHDAGQTVPAQAMAAANPGDVDLARLRPAARSYYTADGQLLAVPFNTSMPLLYVNNAQLANSGVDRSTLGTLAGVAAAARKIHAATPEVKGLVQPFDGWWFEQLTAASGSLYCTPDNGRKGAGATALSLTGDAQRSAIDTVARLYTDGAGLDTGTDGNAALTAFTSGKVAMMFNSSGAIGGLKKAGMTGYSTLPYPLSGDRASSGALIGGAALWVDRVGHSDAEQVAAWKVISYLVSPEAQARFAEMSGYAPINTAVDAAPAWQAFLAKNPDYAVLTKQFADTPAIPATAGCLTGAMSGIRAAVVSQMQQAFSGAVPLDQALAAAQQAGTSKIGDYRKQAGK